MAWFLSLHGPNQGFTPPDRFQLAVNADVEQIERELDDADPGEFVKIPIDYPDHIYEHQGIIRVVRVQPHIYGAWTLYEVAVAESNAQLAVADRMAVTAGGTGEQLRNGVTRRSL